MGWLKRLFGLEKLENQETVNAPAYQAPVAEAQSQAQPAASAQTIPPERLGLNGEYDQSGLAKRVALAFDEEPSLQDVDTLYVAQTGGTVVLKGSVPSQEILDQMVAIAS